MSDSGWPLARELFDAIVDLPHAERAAHLGRARVGPEVRAEVERMLRADGATASFLESSSSFLEWALLPRMGTRIGRYELKRVIASGGMGTVFEAVQDEPRRTVALKTLRLGLFASPERVQRFRFEAEVLGQLRHPSIAQVYEAGTHEEAGEVVPFIAMELVPGARDLLSYAREEGLELPERLALLLEVCEAVLHGHQKGVLHRDLKPGNILVDAEGRAKVIDFGVARATARSSPFGEVATQTGQILGTFAYMAPEQLAGRPDDVDVRSDVYALGILLFELIEGRPPHELESKSPVEALRTIQEEPPLPSPGTPRELRWILEKALAKEPERRYGSVAELAEDLRRHLRGEPVLAGPPSTAYRLSKWIRRNPAKAAAAAIASVAVLVITLQVEAARKRADEVLQLSALQDLDDLTAEADRLWPALPENLPRFEQWLEKARELTAQLPDHERKLAELRSKALPWRTEQEGQARASHPRLAELEGAERELQQDVAELDAEVSQRPGLNFTETEDRWWHNQLAKLVDGLKAFTDPKSGLLSAGVSADHGWGMRKRHEFARTVEERTVSGSQARASWVEAIASIRDPGECPLYEGLVLTPQLGLLPIGRDSDSGLWEFAHLQTGEPAKRGADGKLVLTGETGLVLVLIPGGTFWMGAQSEDPSGRNYDPQALAERESPVHEITLAPFFLSKYELTQGQWASFLGRNPSYYPKENYETDWNEGHRPWSPLQPVEQVNWTDCTETLPRLSLELPTEAQWEYAARAGTSTVWWSGNEQESLREVGNIADGYAKEHGGAGWPTLFESWLDDGNTAPAVVGSYRANAFGLHDVIGNVWEWCRDRYGRYGTEVRRGDGEHLVDDPRTRVSRGGGFFFSAVNARSASRNHDPPVYRRGGLGARPARRITP